MTKSDLLKQAVSARELAYAPYSNFRVGAALLTASGEVFTGCNIENASYGLTICAERTAVFKAVSAGQTRFQMIALSLLEAGPPCGACRQVLNEFAPGLTVLLGDEAGRLVEEVTLEALFPRPFGPKNLSG